MPCYSIDGLVPVVDVEAFVHPDAATAARSLGRLAGGPPRIAVLFADLDESTPLAHALELEDLQGVLRSFQELCSDEIERDGGRVVQHLGDVPPLLPNRTPDAEGQRIVERGELAVPFPQVPFDPLVEGRVLPAGGAGRDDEELVAAVPAKEIGLSHGLPQDVRAGFQHAVAVQMAVGIVDLLEPVHVEKDE